jgi:hypothetical protein
MTFLWWFCTASYIAVCLMALTSCWPSVTSAVMMTRSENWVLTLFACRIQKNWQVRPLPSENCTYRPQNFVVLSIFNITSDAALMSIPLPILKHLRVSSRRKLGVSVLLSSGVFVISTAIVRVTITLVGEPTVITINLWGFRELGVGLIAVTAPIIYPMFTPEFWRPGRYVRDNRRPILQPSLHIPSGSFKDHAIELECAYETAAYTNARGFERR